MLGLIGSRLLQFVIVSFFVLTALFVLVRLIGDPAAMRLGTEASAEDLEKLRHAMGLDRPMIVQYWEFLWAKIPHVTRDPKTGGMVFVVLDFGKSFESSRPAIQDILRRVPYSAWLAGTAFSFAVLMSPILGILSARYRNSWGGWAVMGGTLIWQTVPSFVFALLLLLMFSVTWRIFPSFGVDGWKSMVLPSIALAFFPLSRLTRIVRSQMLEVMSQDYIRTARAKGLSEPVVTYRHAFRNAIIPWVTLLGLDFAGLMGGSLIVEQIFLWPGIGRGILEAVTHRDYPTIEAGAFVITIIVVAANLWVDVAYRLIDPRIGWGGKKS